MRPSAYARLALATAVVAAGSSGAFAATSAAASSQVGMPTAVDVSPAPGPDGDLTLSHVAATGARYLRIDVGWNDIAPATRPAGFDPANPDSPGYDWSWPDGVIKAAAQRGLQVLVSIVREPVWAQSPYAGGPGPQGPGPGWAAPDPTQLGLFAHAAALHFDGNHGLPRVAAWAVWNEPNWSYFLAPQLVGGQDVAVDRYRDMVNAVAAGVHSARADDLVVGGELFPVATQRGGLIATAPMQFARELLCVSAGSRPQRTCASQLHADVVSVHPYTSGGPSTLPANPDNVWIATLPKFTALVHAAQSLGTLVSSGPVATWVTEFAWTTNPPRGGGVPAALAQRWVAETLYRSWQAGIGLFTWFSLRDDPINVSSFQTGLYYACANGQACDQPKPLVTSFRFPFVAYSQAKRRVLVWGRTPPDVVGPVQVQVRRRGRWITLATLRPNAGGVFTSRLRLPRKVDPRSAMLRSVGSDHVTLSAPFSLKRPKDLLVKPFL